MKSILISIQPKWVAKILNGEKTIEIRKTMPKCDLPIDVYIYCTKENHIGKFGDGLYHEITKNSHWSNGCSWNMPKIYLEGKVVAKFTLNKVEEITNRYCKGMLIDSCLTNYELNNYLGNCIGFAWHISNPEIFDKPKELIEFYKIVETSIGYELTDIKKEKPLKLNGCIPLTKAPQSWQFIETGEQR